MNTRLKGTKTKIILYDEIDIINILKEKEKEEKSGEKIAKQEEKESPVTV